MSYSDNPFIPQMLSPTAYEMGRFGRTPASHFYGLPNIAIPLTEVRAKGFVLPITLSYNAGGHKPDQHPGWVGLGWSLNAGGSIVRVINGMKDEMSATEYCELHGMQLTEDPGYLYHTDEVQTGTDWNDDQTLSENSLPWVEHEPDEYIINVDGIHASFFITGEKTIAVVSKEESCIELESCEIANDTGSTSLDLYPGKCTKPLCARRYSYIRSFVIRDKYGNRYFFGGDDSAIEYSVVQYPTLVARENGYTNTNAWKAIATANAWMLTRIERTDGEVVTFGYEKNGVPIVFSDIHHGGMFVSPEYPQLNFNYDTYQNMLYGWKDNLHFHFLLPSYLKSIKCLQSGDELDFTTEDTVELPYPITESDFCTYVGDFSGEHPLAGPFSYSDFQAENRYRKLVRISGVKRNIAFEYTDSAQTRLKLTGISLNDGMENGGQYLFSYNPTGLPAYNSRKTDVWGYYNDIDYSGILAGFCDGMTEVRVPSENMMKAEILVAVTYPTGGRTEYTYEPHTYKKTALPFTFAPEACQSEMMAGGLRIKSVTDYATDGVPQTRTFEYAEDGVPSGILCTQIQCRASGEMAYADDHVVYTGTYAIYSEMPLLPLSDTDGRHVTYSFVRERFPDGGYVDYRFTNFDTEGCQDCAPANEVGRGTECPLFPQFTSRSLFRGLVKERTTYRSDGKVLIRELFSYGDEGATTHFKSVSRHSFAGGHVLFAAYVSAHCGYPALLTRSETRYLDDDSVMTETYEYSYNGRRLLTRASHSRGSDSIEERFHYPEDRSGRSYEMMTEAGMHGVQVGKAYLRDDRVIRGSETIFFDRDIAYGQYGTRRVMLPQKLFSTALAAPLTFSEYNSDPMSYQQSVPDVWLKIYETTGNVRSVGFRDGTGAEFHWGQRTGQPVMKLQGKDVPFDSTISPHNMRIGYLSPEFSTTFRTTEKKPFEATLYSDYMYGFSVYIRIDDVTYYLTNWSIPEMPDEIWMERHDNTNTMILDLPAGDHTLVIRVSDWRGNPASQDETGATLLYSYYVEPEYQDLGSFADLDIDTEEGEGFHCEKGHVGPLTLSHPVVAGKTYILDYMLKSDGAWQYVKTAYAGGDVTVGGEGRTVSNVRIYPEDCMPESFSWRPYTGMSARTDARGVTESYVFDDAGRLSQTRDNRGNVIKAHSYSFGSDSRIVTEVFTSADATTGIRTVNHYDGLGRPSQDVLVDGAGSGKDLVTLHQYDLMDREVKTWLPSTVPTSGGREAGDLATMDQIMDGGDGLYGASDPVRYSENIFEASPQERIMRKYGPGKAWRDADKAVRTELLSNGQDETLPTCHVGYYITWDESSLTLKRIYGKTSSGTYLIEKTTDEDGRIAFVFMNLYGDVVLNRQIGPDGAWFDTHFIYDSFGRLEAVLPPKLTAELEASTKTGWSESDISGLAYIYRYDSRGNCIAKLLPGGGWTYYVYDKGNRLVFSQDAVQRENGEWTFNLVDIFGRECVKGTAVIDLDVFSDPLGEVNAYVTMPSVPTYTDTLKGYVLTGVSLGSGVVILKVNYYDGYGFLGSGPFPAAGHADVKYDALSGCGARYDGSDRGLLTGALAKVIGRNAYGNMLWTLQYYDDRGRVIQKNSKSHLSAVNKEYMSYRFSGALSAKMILCGAVNIGAQRYNYYYDSMERPIFVRMNIYGFSKLICRKQYDDIGRIRDMAGDQALESTYETRSYNIRSWLTEIDGPMFAEIISYNSGSAPQWGGNISQIQWRAGTETPVRMYGFTYDALSRLMSATYAEPSGNNLFNETYGYDQNGNLTRLIRDGLNTAGTSRQRLLSLNIIGYSGNRLMQAGTSLMSYDGKGRLISSNYGTSLQTEYNDMDLPVRYIVGNNMTVDFLYDADGRKLWERVDGQSSYVVRDYDCNCMFENNSLRKVFFEGGYMEILASGEPVFKYFLKDHLGSVRVVVSQTGAIEQVNHYYPYGDRFADSRFGQSGEDNRMRYTGKELCTETGLYDFSARFLNTRFGRFTTLDPLAEKYPNISPYAYCNCNPVNFVDPDGMYFKKVIRKNAITIKATYYVQRHDKKSYRSAHLATEFWNNRQDIYISPSGKQYVVNYELLVEEVNDISRFKQNNTYEVVKSFESQDRAGASARKRNIQVLESYSETRPGTDTPSTTGAHEIGHTLGMSDGGVGIMSPSQDDSRTNDVTQENLQQMINCDKGDQDWFSSFFPIK